MISYTDFGKTQTVDPTCHHQDGQVFTPNIPDYYFDHQNAAAFRTGSGVNMTDELARRYFITPSYCGGAVEAIQYCYQTESRRTNEITGLTFALLNRNGLTFTVEQYDEVQISPCSEACTSFEDFLVCCNTTVFERNRRNRRLNYSMNHSIGTYVGCCGTYLLSAALYHSEHFQPSLSRTAFQRVGYKFTLTEQDRVGNSLPLLRVVIGKYSPFLSKHQLVMK